MSMFTAESSSYNTTSRYKITGILELLHQPLVLQNTTFRKSHLLSCLGEKQCSVILSIVLYLQTRSKSTCFEMIYTPNDSEDLVGSVFREEEVDVW
jgi:hypothetical protein